MSRGVYLHIPYCLSKCAYCDFASQPLPQPQALADYLLALMEEIRQRACGPAQSIYFGGGTPSLCTPAQLSQILTLLACVMQISKDAEITIEANPGAGQDWVGFRRAGVNRLSFGIQSTQDPFLRMLQRPHSAAQAEQAMAAARAAGFDNIGCDLMYGLPGQTMAQYKADLENLLSWQPDHVSLYALSLEPQTPLAQAIGQGHWPSLNEDLAAEMYVGACDLLESEGYEHYELSNFSLPGRWSRHNCLYWQNQEYLGIGAAAHSYLNSERTWNIPDAQEYVQKITCQKPVQAGHEILTSRAKAAETIMLGLRMVQGISKPWLDKRFGNKWQAWFGPAFERMQTQGLVDKNTETIRLTPKGWLLANIVFRELI